MIIYRPVILLVALALLFFTCLASLSFGASDIPFAEVWNLLTTLESLVGLTSNSSDQSTEALVIHALRLPRTLVALLAGAGLGVAGLMFQAVTRNPLADPGILGVEAGGALAILLLIVFFPAAATWLFVPFAFLGGTLTAVLVYGIAHTVGITPLRLALAGVAVASFTVAFIRGVQILWEERAQGALFALSGSVAGRSWEHVYQVAPWLVVALLLALFLSAKLNVLALGEDIARGLGVQTERDSMLIVGLGVLLAASAVSVVGPVGFVGLVIPHIARGLIGVDHRYNLPLSALLGATFLVLADIAARLIDKPAETPVGILIAAVGAPFFVLLARRVGRFNRSDTHKPRTTHKPTHQKRGTT